MALTTVDDVAAMLRWGDAERTRFEADLAAYVAAGSELVESDAGPFEERTVEHVTNGGARSILLPIRVSAVESVEVMSGSGYQWVDGYYVPGGGWSVVDGWTVDLTAGIIRGTFPAGHQNIKVTFTTGFATVPEAAKLAATMVAADKWAIASQRAPGLDDRVDPVYLMPKAVRELLAPFKKTTMPGFA